MELLPISPSVFLFFVCSLLMEQLMLHSNNCQQTRTRSTCPETVLPSLKYSDGSALYAHRSLYRNYLGRSQDVNEESVLPEIH